MKKFLLTLVGLLSVVPAVFAAPLDGAKCEQDIVWANGTDEHKVIFRGGEPAYITVNGDTDTDLDLYVYDKRGNLIAKHTDLSDQCAVTFTPNRTEEFTIRVLNRGSDYNKYRICVA